MKKYTLFPFCLILVFTSVGQTSDSSLKMVSNYSSNNSEIRDILQFEGIDFYKIKFTGSSFIDKGYRLSVKEIWDGKVVSDSTIINSKELPFQQYRQVNDTVLDISVLAKHLDNNTLKMTFKFPRFSIDREFEATASTDYSLRNIAEESKLEIEYGKAFNWLAYILPYDREDGSKSWCEVSSDGLHIESWGENFGIKHYLIFEMKFE